MPIRDVFSKPPFIDGGFATREVPASKQTEPPKTQVSLVNTPSIEVPKEQITSLQWVDPGDHVDMNTEFALLEEHSEKVNREIEVLEFLLSLDLEKAMEDKDYLLTQVKAVLSPIGKVDQANQYAAIASQILKTYVDSAQKQGSDSKWVAASGLMSEELKKQVKLAELIGQASEIEKLKIKYESLKKEREEIKNSAQPNQDQIDKLDGQIDQLQIRIQRMSDYNSRFQQEFAAGTGLLLPCIAQSSFNLVARLNQIMPILELTSGMTIASSLAAMVSGGLQLHIDSQAKSAHQRAIKDLHPPTVEVVQNKDPSHPTVEVVQKLLNKRQETAQKRVKKEARGFDRMIDSIVLGREGDISQITEDLKRKGMHLDKTQNPPKTIEEFKTRLKEDVGFRASLIEQISDYKDTMTNVAKNQLKARLLENEKINEKFFNFKNTRSKIYFAIVSIASIATTVLTSLVLATFALPVLPFVLPTIASFGVLGWTYLVGGWHLKEHKPHLFEKIMQGVKIELSINSIPLSFYKWRLEANRVKFKQNAEALRLLSVQEDKISEDKLAKLKLDQAKLQNKVAHYEERFAFFNNKSESLNQKLSEARAKDYEFNTGYKLEDLQTITWALVEGEFWRDPEALATFEKYADIKLPYMPERPLNEEERKSLESFLEKRLREGILKNSADIMKWVSIYSKG